MYIHMMSNNWIDSQIDSYGYICNIVLSYRVYLQHKCYQPTNISLSLSLYIYIDIRPSITASTGYMSTTNETR